MAEERIPLKFPPGIYHNGTKTQAAGRWYDGNGVRFYQGTIGPIGGWVQHGFSSGTLSGRPHAVLDFPDSAILNVGTDLGLYAAVLTSRTPTTVASGIADITPAVLVGVTGQQWQLASFGTLVIAVCKGAGVYKWDFPGGGGRATAAYTTGPTGSFGVIATPERFLVLLGGSDALQIPSNPYSARRVYWPSQQTINDFVATDTNTAGWYDLDTDGELRCGLVTRGMTLLFTTTDLWEMTYIGGTLVHAFKRVAGQCGIVSQNAAAYVDSRAFWMGNGKFFVYNGYVDTLPCEVSDRVFGDFALAYSDKVFCVPNPLFNEISWYYPSAASTDCDRYVTYNYKEEHWTYGALSRTAGTVHVARPTQLIAAAPVMFDASGHIFEHEMGSTRSGMTVYLESGPVIIGEGDKVARVQRFIPDDKTQGDVSATLYAALEPDAAETSQGPVTLTSPTPMRITGRQFRVRLQEVVATMWRVGVVKLGVILGGDR